MTCRDIDRALPEGSLSSELRQHVAGCARCGALLDAVSNAPAGDPSPDLLASIERKLTAGLTPVKPLRPAWQFAVIWALALGAVVAIGVARLHPLALARMGAAESAAVLTTLAAAATALILSLARQMSPGSRFAIPPALLPAAALIACAALFALLFPFRAYPGFVRTGWKCFSVGLFYAAIAAVPVVVSLRRGAFSSASLAGATAGCLAGFAGLAVLSIHCPILEISHVFAAHLGAAVAATLAGIAVASLRPQPPN